MTTGEMHRGKRQFARRGCFTRILLIMIGFLSLQTGKAQNSSISKWTVMVYLNADNSLDEYAEPDFVEMANIGSDSNINIVVQMDRKLDTWGDSKRFRVRKGMDEPTELNAIPNQSLGETNMGDPKVLTEFVQWAIREYPAKRYALIVWGHGAGMRTEGESFRSVDSINGILPQVSFPFRSVSPDDSHGDRLFGREIQDIWQDSTMTKLDLIGFDACKMGMLENCYAFRNIADVMVASEEVINLEGWDYEMVFKELRKNPEMNAKDFSIHIVQAYEATYDKAKNRTLSAINLVAIREFSDSLSSVCKLISTSDMTEQQMVRKARAQCATFDPHSGFNGIDLFTFLKEYLKLSTSPNIKDVLTRLLLLERKIIIRNYAGKARRYLEKERSFGAHGISIFFPVDKDHFKVDGGSLGYFESTHTFSLEFVKDQFWDNFLLNIIGLKK